MEKNIFISSDMDVEIWYKDGKYLLRYDAGSHTVEYREDEISKEEVDFALISKSNLISLLWKLQERLIKSGVSPYVSNMPDKS
jgi:hypothetical protein